MSWLTDIFKEGRVAVLFDEINDLDFQTIINEDYSIQTQIVQESYRHTHWMSRTI